MRFQGGVIGVFINWKCNFDADPLACVPTYAFRRLDVRKNLPYSGYNYRWVFTKSLMLAYRVIAVSAPTYFNTLVRANVTPRMLRSSHERRLALPSVQVR